MLKKDIPVQYNLFGISTVPVEPKKKRNILSSEEKAKRKKEKEAHRIWKLYKSRQFDKLLTEEDKQILLNSKYRNMVS
jgi:hypothetical protein